LDPDSIGSLYLEKAKTDSRKRNLILKKRNLLSGGEETSSEVLQRGLRKYMEFFDQKIF
jgi:hypothetical protein